MKTTALNRGFALLAVVAITGCASSGNEVLRSQDTAAVERSIVDGRTTRSEVERIYGPPTTTSFTDAQNDIWIYRWSRATAKAENFVPYVGAFMGGADVQRKELVILFNAQNVVVRHSMRDSTEQVRRNLSASASPTPTAGRITTSPAPGTAGAAVEPPRAAAVSASGLSAPPLEPGRWTCRMRTFSNGAERYYPIEFTVAADGAIVVASYRNAPATPVAGYPRHFTAVNPNGDRPVTFSLAPDGSMVMTGPSRTNPGASFRDRGTCTRA